MIGTGLTPCNRSQDGGNGYLPFVIFYCIQTGIDERKCDKERRLEKESYWNQVCVCEKECLCVYIAIYVITYIIY